MARLNHLDDRGVVYVEFLIAFFPLFLLFLALCQLALVGAAEAVVRHSAYAAARSAIVVLEDDPKKFDRADRGSLTQGKSKSARGLGDVTSKLGIEPVSLSLTNSRIDSSVVANLISQDGARMVPIQTAAYLPLLPLAPSEQNVNAPSVSVSSSLVGASNRQLGFAVGYTKAAAIVTVHDSEESEALALDPIQPHAPITTRVTYLFHCTIPVVRAIMCRSLKSVATGGYLAMALSNKLEGNVPADARFKLLTATATLPNQGAGYMPRSAE